MYIHTYVFYLDSHGQFSSSSPSRQSYLKSQRRNRGRVRLSRQRNVWDTLCTSFGISGTLCKDKEIRRKNLFQLGNIAHIQRILRLKDILSCSFSFIGLLYKENLLVGRGKLNDCLLYSVVNLLTYVEL